MRRKKLAATTQQSITLKSLKRLARNIRKKTQTRGRKSNDESLSLYYKVKVKNHSKSFSGACFITLLLDSKSL